MSQAQGMAGKIKVAVIQQECSPEKSVSMSRTKAMLEVAKKDDGVQLAVLQELHCTHYFCQREDRQFFDLAETIPGASTDYFCEIAKALSMVLVVSVFEKSLCDGKTTYYNTAVVIENDGSIAGTYRKSHIPEDPGFHEKFYFSPGDTALAPIETSLGKLGILICWDQWFPEAARSMALAGADVLIYPTAIGWIPEDPAQECAQYVDAWQTMMRSHAIANGLPVLCANRVGTEVDEHSVVGQIKFWGQSFIAGCYGEIVAQGDEESYEILSTELSWSRTAEVRKVWPFFRDRRIDLYRRE